MTGTELSLKQASAIAQGTFQTGLEGNALIAATQLGGQLHKHLLHQD